MDHETNRLLFSILDTTLGILAMLDVEEDELADLERRIEGVREIAVDQRASQEDLFNASADAIGLMSEVIMLETGNLKTGARLPPALRSPR